MRFDFFQVRLFILFILPLIFLNCESPVTNVVLTEGTPVDSLDGVLVYYNGSVDHVDGRNITSDGYNLGLKYQCVEFVKRYYYQHFHHKMPNAFGHAKDFFDSIVNDGELNTKRNLLQFKNGSKSQPKKGDLLVMNATIFNSYGHVAIISSIDEHKIEIIQQTPGPAAPSRVKLPLVKKNGLYYI